MNEGKQKSCKNFRHLNTVCKMASVSSRPQCVKADTTLVRQSWRMNCSYPLTNMTGDELINYPNSKVRGANMGPIWGRQDPGGPHVGPMNFAIWVCYISWWRHQMETFFRVTGPLILWGEFTGHWWIPLTKASDAERWCFLWSASEQTVEQTIEKLAIWDVIDLITCLMSVWRNDIN